MPDKYDDYLILKLEKETKDKLRELATRSERTMSAWVRYQINREFSELTADRERAELAS